MKTNIGEAGTEQFVLTTRVDGKLVSTQPLHDPFMRTTIKTGLSRWDHFKNVFRPKPIVTEVMLDGSEGVVRAIMTMDPHILQVDTEMILEERRIIRAANDAAGVMGYYAETPAR
jgi:hypothetical protein